MLIGVNKRTIHMFQSNEYQGVADPLAKGTELWNELERQGSPASP